VQVDRFEQTGSDFLRSAKKTRAAVARERCANFCASSKAFDGKHRAAKDRKLNNALRYPLLMLAFFLIIGPHNAGVEGSSPSLSTKINRFVPIT